MTSPSASSRDLQSTNHSHRHHHLHHQPPSWIPPPSDRPYPQHHQQPPAPSHPGPFYQAAPTLPGGTQAGGTSQKGRGVAGSGVTNTSRRDQRLTVDSDTQEGALLEDGDCAGRVDRESSDTGSMLGDCATDSISDPRRRMRRRELSQFSPEEADRILRRRERNKVAATKCRHKRHAQHEHLVKELQGMECENTSLTYEIRQLQRQRQALSDVLRHHQMSCSSHHQFNLADIPADNKMPPGGLSGPYPLPYTR